MDPSFASWYTDFVFQCVKRYPWIDAITPVNETFTAAIMCGLVGQWHPFDASDQSFVRVALAVSKAECMVSEMLRQELPNALIIDATPIEEHYIYPGCVEPSVSKFVQFMNDRRFLTLDLQYGMVTQNHPLLDYLRTRGAGDQELQWFTEHPAHNDVLGFDYYAHSSHQSWVIIDGQIVRVDACGQPSNFTAGPKPIGLTELAKQYHNRYPKIGKMLTETNIPGGIADRILWLWYTSREWNIFSDHLMTSGASTVEGRATGGYCWFPIFDSRGWGENMRGIGEQPDIHGIVYLDPQLHRHESELSQLFSDLAKGIVNPLTYVPDCSFDQVIARNFSGFQELFDLPSAWRNLDSDYLDQDSQIRLAS